MSQNPLLLAAPFFLELALLAALAVAGWRLSGVGWRYVVAIGLPLLAAALWGIFRVPNDGGPPTVQVSGIVRLLLELFFSAAVVAVMLRFRRGWALTLAAITLLHYVLSYDRLLWLLRAHHRPKPISRRMDSLHAC